MKNLLFTTICLLFIFTFIIKIIYFNNENVNLQKIIIILSIILILMLLLFLVVNIFHNNYYVNEEIYEKLSTNNVNLYNE